MLQPGRTKYRKQFRGKMRGLSKGSLVSFGEYGLKSLECSWVTANQIESARRAISNHTKRGGHVWVRLFPDKPITQKGAGSPLGAGKGDVTGYVCVVRPGKVMFEIGGIAKEQSYEALKIAASKLPVKTKIIEKK